MEETVDSAEWVVQRVRRDRRRLTVTRTASIAAGLWVARLRRLVPDLGSQTPGELLDQVRRTGRIELGVMAGREAYRIHESLRSNGFEVSVEDASDVVLLPIHRVRGFAMIHEGDAESDAFCRKLIANGAPIQEVET